MSYRRSLLVRWNQRDRLSVLVVGVTVAFLVGTTLLLVAVGTQTAAIAADRDAGTDATYHETVDAARDAAGQGAVVVPIARVSVDGDRRYAVGVANGTEARYGPHGRTLTGNGPPPTLGTLTAPEAVTLAGRDGDVTLSVAPRGRRSSVFPPTWYVTLPATVERLGPTGAFVLEPSGGSTGGGPAVPLVGALSFFLTGTRQAVRTLGVVAAGGAVLVGVTVYSVTRMTVRDRLDTIRVVRATGGTPATVLGLFGLRAGLLTATGVAVGYAAGVILSRAAVSVAVALGLPTSLSVAVTGRAVAILVPTFLGVLIVGAVAGVAAAVPAVRRPPARLTGHAAGEGAGLAAALPGPLAPRLLGWRALVPTTATLTVFVVFVVLVAALGAVASPLVAAQGATVTEPGATHPVASQVPAAYVETFGARDIDASAEILLFGMHGHPVPARGANYEAFAAVTDATIVRGRPPAAPNEAAIGADLARTLDVGVGDAMTLGGSTSAGLTRIEIVGVFVAPGPFDDQLVVPLPLARHLADVPVGQVQFVRVNRLPAVDTGTGSVGVVDLRAPATVAAGSTVEARVTVRNDGLERATERIQIGFDGGVRVRTVSLAPGGQRTIRVPIEAGKPGTATLRAGDLTRRVRFVDRDAIRIEALPDRAPVDSRPLVRVVTATDRPVANATVSVGNRTVRTDGEGRARIELPTTGERTVTARSGDREVTTTVRVARTATRRPAVSVALRPQAPSPFTRPRLELGLFNPWARPIEWSVHLAGPNVTVDRTVTVPPGADRTMTVALPRRPPGEYGVLARVDNRTVADEAYAVTGDDRIAAALATRGVSGSTGIGRALSVAFGNVRIVLGAVLVLAAAMTVGGTTASFAQAVHARRRTIGIRRATGADALAIGRLVVGDALRVGVVATLLAVLLGWAVLTAVARVDVLTVYGVRLQPTPGPTVLLGAVAGALAVTAVSAAVAARVLVGAQPAALLWDRPDGPGGERDG